MLLPFYSQIFNPEPLPSKMAPVNTCGLHMEGTLFKSLPGRLAIMTDSLDMSVFGLVEPEEGGTKIHHNVGNYTHTCARTCAHAYAHVHAQHHFPEELNLQMPCFQPNSQKDFSCLYMTHSISSQLYLLYSDSCAYLCLILGSFDYFFSSVIRTLYVATHWNNF
jgi:hypothetical protein